MWVLNYAFFCWCFWWDPFLLFYCNPDHLAGHFNGIKSINPFSRLIHLSIHPFTHLIQFRVTGAFTGAYSSCHWARSRVYPAQITSQSQGQHTFRITYINPTCMTYVEFISEWLQHISWILICHHELVLNSLWIYVTASHLINSILLQTLIDIQLN